MRSGLSAIFAAFVFLSSCGYVGPVLPPSPQIPVAITDLTAVERGDVIIVTFSTPARTTDGVAINRFSAIEVEAAPVKVFSLEPPPPSDRGSPQSEPIIYKIPVADFAGRRLSISARTAIKKAAHFSAPSNIVALDVVPPLITPVVRAEASAHGIVLSWDATKDTQYRVDRQGPDDKQPVSLATVAADHYTDTAAQYDIAYRYIVTATQRLAESLPSEALSFKAVDTFAPAVPTDISIVAGAESVNLAWQRNTERDLQGYVLYRSTNGGPFKRQEPPIALPTYVDRNVEHGKTYRYKVSAVDKKSNESAKSDPVEMQF